MVGELRLEWPSVLARRGARDKARKEIGDLTLAQARSTGAASFMVEFFEVIVGAFGTQPSVLSGPLAQLVEQLTLNQRVAGSSPARLTTSSILFFVFN